MQIGFTFDEKALSYISASDWLSKAHGLGARSIELAPDCNILPVSKYLEIAKAAAALGIGINYHIPYFASEHYSVESFFKNQKLSAEKYEEFLSILEQISEILGNSESVIVLHGEEFHSLSEKTLDNTVEFMNYLASKLEFRKLNHRLAIESLGLGSSEKIGNSRAELLEILSRLEGDRFGICLDICHDSLNYFPTKPTSDTAFYEKIIYSHIHGFNFNSGKKHLSISRSQLNFLDQIISLKKIKPETTLNIESLSDFIGSSYLEELFEDISLLSSIL